MIIAKEQPIVGFDRGYDYFPMARKTLIKQARRSFRNTQRMDLRNVLKVLFHRWEGDPDDLEPWEEIRALGMSPETFFDADGQVREPYPEFDDGYEDDEVDRIWMRERFEDLWDIRVQEPQGCPVCGGRCMLD